MHSKISDFTSCAEIYARPRSPDMERKWKWRRLGRSHALVTEIVAAVPDRSVLVNSGWLMGCNIHDHTEWMQFKPNSYPVAV
jgi:hypothetical protein